MYGAYISNQARNMEIQKKKKKSTNGDEKNEWNKVGQMQTRQIALSSECKGSV